MVMTKSRNEKILENILGADNALQAPQSRIETLLQAILEQGDLSKPTTAGTYVLKVTVVADEPVYEWAAIDVG